jgi:hypothetical protein
VTAEDLAAVEAGREGGREQPLAGGGDQAAAERTLDA